MEAEKNPNHPPPPPRSALRSVVIVATCTLAMLVNTASATSSSIALPKIGQDLDIPAQKLQWIVSAYSLTSGCLLLFFGRLADLYGRKRAFVAGSLCMFTFALGCGFAKNDITIDILRGFQGLGAAATIPASLGILAHAFPPSRARSLAFATFSAGAPVGAALGMVIGGVLTQLTRPSWRSTFYFSAGLTALCLIGGIISMDADIPSTETDARVDWIGAALVTVGLTLIVFVLSDGEIAPNGWKTPYIIVLLILGVLLVVAFLFWQRYLESVLDDPNAKYSKWTPPPLMKLSLWKRAKGKMAVMLWVAFLNWSCFLAWNFWVQLYYQDYLRLSPVLTMVRLLPMFLTGIVCNFIVALVVGRVDVVFLIVTGTLFTGCAAIFFAAINPSAPYWAFGFPAAIISVFGADFTFASGTLFVAKVALPHEQSLAGALFQTMTQLGTAFGLTISTIVFNRVLKRGSLKLGVVPDASGMNVPLPAQLKAYEAAQWTAFGFGMLATLLAIVFLRGVGIVGHQHPNKEKETDSEHTVAETQ
ncbi:hypothetical protein JAAARDRAFT_127904 [Jaapia argillacea MUCL 33604]|uniref:Major facilitator superfamily (MFS) profile domain-containing protein n=1 Tax=Jaapia argillacea MUCL 33604 TaxID=933084 RepID=A0A067Q5R0_9AGAM|nr:hypothetical protein JAAARDRAFT_127904 [Jaapia argillacea MUCL 33604]